MSRYHRGGEWLAARAVATDTTAPGGHCELCGRRTPETYRFDQMYARFCCSRHADLAGKRVARGLKLTGVYVERVRPRRG